MERSVEGRLLDLEERVALLENPPRFSERAQGLTCIGIVREWLKTHDTISARLVCLEAAQPYTPDSYRMATHRLWKIGELIRIGFGLYRVNPDWDSLRNPMLVVRLSKHQRENIKADTTSSHAELGRKYGVSPTTIANIGHRSPYNGNKRSGASRPLSS